MSLLAQLSRAVSWAGNAGKKRPRKSGAEAGRTVLGRIRRPDRASVAPPSKPEIRQVSVADGDAGAGHQQTIDSRHQAPQQSGSGREAEGGGFGHIDSLRGSADQRQP